MKRWLTRVIFVVAPISLAAIAFGAVSVAGAFSSHAAAGTPRCRTGTLVIWLDTQGQGTAGSTHYNLEFTNPLRHSCSLIGYPGVSAVGLKGKQLGRAAVREHTTRPSRITLRPNQTASVELKISDVANIPRRRCRRVTAAGLRVYPPNDRSSKVVPFPFRACTRPGPTYLQVRALHRNGTGMTP